MQCGYLRGRQSWIIVLLVCLAGGRPTVARTQRGRAVAAAAQRLANIAAGRPHILLSAMEFGRLEHLRDTRGRPLNVQAGGQAIVVNDFLTELPSFVAPLVVTGGVARTAPPGAVATAGPLRRGNLPAGNQFVQEGAEKAADAKAACEERTEALREQLRVLERELAAMP